MTPPENSLPSSLLPHCPACGASLAADAVLCVACGYHLKLEHHLATVVDRVPPRPDDSNPFASPAAIDGESADAPRGAPYEADLTEAGARRAGAIVSEADMVYWTIGLATICFPICGILWPFLLPWYAWRLWSWRSLNARFNELRNPNGFSPHGQLAGSFQDCLPRLWVGIVAGAIFWMLFALYLAGTTLDALLQVPT